jgi:hypothetical protein
MIVRPWRFLERCGKGFEVPGRVRRDFTQRQIVKNKKKRLKFSRTPNYQTLSNDIKLLKKIVKNIEEIFSHSNLGVHEHSTFCAAN